MKQNKLIIFFLVFLGLVMSVNSIAFDITTYNYTGYKLNTSSQGTGSYGLAKNDVSNIFYKIDPNTPTIYQYNCTQSNNLNSCTYASISKSVSAQDTIPTALTFSNDGSKLYVVGDTNNLVYQYNCSTNYLLSSCSYASISKGVSSSPWGITFNNDGSRFYITDQNAYTISQYNCTTNYLLNTCAYSNNISSLGNRGLTFNNDGSKLYNLLTASNIVYQYNCSTNYLLSSCINGGNLILTNFSGYSNNNIVFDNDGSNFYVSGYTGSSNNFIYQYSTILYQLSFSSISLTNNTYFNSSSIQINTTVLNTSTNSNVNQTAYLYYNNGTLVSTIQYATNSLTGQLNLTGLIDNTYKISFYARNNETNVSTGNYTFTIDLTAPTISNNISSVYYSYTNNNFSSSCTDTNLQYCNISYDSKNLALNISNLYNFSVNGNISYTIKAKDLANNTIISTGIILVNPYQRFYFSNGSTLLSNYTFNGITFNNTEANFTIYNNGLNIGSNTLLFEKLGYASTNVTFTLNTTSNLNLTTNITQSKIIVSVYDRTTGSLISGTTTLVEIIATTGYNTTTTTGQVNISNINFINEVYTIKATNSNYYPEYIYFNYNNQQALPVSLYLINTSLTNAGIVTIQLITNSGQRVNNAICSLLEWKPSQSAYVSVAQGQTNINGEYVFNIEVGTKFYKISCTKVGETAVSNAQIFTASGYTLPLQIGAAFTTPSSLFQSISYNMNNVSYNSTHDIIYLNASDTNGLTTQICLNVYKISGVNPTLLNPNNCTIASSVINKYVIVQKTNLSNNIIVKAEVVLAGVTYTLDSITYLSDNSIARALDDYHLDILLPLIFILIGITIGLALKPANVFISAIGSIIMVWFSVMIVPTIVSTSIAIFITLISIMIIYGGSKPK